jgi:hypothetical protein
MTTAPKSDPADSNRDSAASSQEARIKQLEAGIQSHEICEKALDLIHKRLASGELSDNMLLRATLSLAKSAAWFSMDGRTQVTRKGPAPRTGRQSRWPRTRRVGERADR